MKHIKGNQKHEVITTITNDSSPSSKTILPFNVQFLQTTVILTLLFPMTLFPATT